MNSGCKQIQASRSRGIAILAALLALAMLTLIALSMTFVSSTEVLINDNNKKRLLQLYAAESACEEARLRIRNLIDLNQLSLTDLNRTVYLVSSSSINPTYGDEATNPYFDSNSESTQIASILLSELESLKFSWVRVWPKTELRAGYSLDDAVLTADPVYFGYSKTQSPAKPTQYVNSGNHINSHYGSPVFLSTAIANEPTGYRQMVTTEIARIPCPPLKAAFFSKGSVQILGSAVSLDGNDPSALSASSLNGLESESDVSGDTSQIHGSPMALRTFSPNSYEMGSLIKMFQPPVSREVEQLNLNISKTIGGNYAANGVMLGSLPANGNLSQAVYVGGSLTLSNSSGQGILIIDGDLTIEGEFIYQGLLIVNGRVSFNGSGSGIQIAGAVLVSSLSGNPSSLLDGTINLVYDSFIIRKQFDSLPYTRIAFRDY